MPSPLPPGWLDHREFIERVGALTDPDWCGNELRAFPRSVYEHDVEKIDNETAAQVYRVQSGIDQARAGGREAMGSDGPPCVVCGDPHTKVIDNQHYCSGHGTPLPIPAALQAVFARPGLRMFDDDEIADAGREMIRSDIDAVYQPERLARERWNRAYARCRDAVAAGAITPAVWCLGELTWPPTDEILAHYPGPREPRVELPSLPLPGWLAFAEADVARVLEPEVNAAKRAGKSDPRNKCRAMIEGLKKALADGSLKQKEPTTLKAAHDAMLRALGHKATPIGMGYDAFCNHCKPWLKEHGIYG